MGGSVTCVKVAVPSQWSIPVSCYSGLGVFFPSSCFLVTFRDCLSLLLLVLCLKCSHSFLKEILLLEIMMFVSSLTL